MVKLRAGSRYGNGLRLVREGAGEALLELLAVLLSAVKGNLMGGAESAAGTRVSSVLSLIALLQGTYCPCLPEISVELVAKAC